MLQLGPETVHHPRKIDPQHQVPLLILQRLDRARPVVLADHACAVGGAGELPKPLYGASDPGVDVGAITDVDAREGHALRWLQRLASVGECRFVNVPDGNPRAAGEQDAGGGEADAAGAAGDGEDFVLQVVIAAHGVEMVIGGKGGGIVVDMEKC